MVKSGRQLVTLYREKEVDPDTHPKLARELQENRTQLTSETGFMMVFGDRRHRNVSPFAAYDLGGDSYPVSEPAFDSLPSYIQATLERDGTLQILAHYDPDSGEFVNVILADKPTPGEFIEWIAMNMSHGLSLHETIDYLAVEEFGCYSEEQWASIREVSTEAIHSNVRQAQDHTESPP